MGSYDFIWWVLLAWVVADVVATILGWEKPWPEL